MPTVSVKVNEGTTWRILVWCRKVLARDNPRLSADELLRTHPGVKPYSDVDEGRFGTHEGR